jgi:TolB protein
VRWKGRLAVLATLLGALTWVPASTATFPGADGRIAYTTPAGTIATVNPDGTDPTSVTSGHVDDHAAWSPDGTKLAFDRQVAGTNSEIFVMNGDGSGLVQLTTDPARDARPAWSPDGTRLVFDSNRDDPNLACWEFSDTCNFELYVMGVDGSNPTRITTSPGQDREADWSPDGSKIAFRGDDGPDRPRIWTIDPDGSDLLQITQFDSSSPGWYPESTKITYVGLPVSNATQGALRSVNRDGTGGASLGAQGEAPVWSPTGGRIAFSSVVCVETCAPDRLQTINYNGTGSNQVALGTEPSWQRLVQPPFGYVRPKGATPLLVSLTLAYRECSDPNRIHGPPLAFASCAPPAPGTTFPMATVGTPDANGVPAKFAGAARLDVRVGNPATAADEADVEMNVTLNDVRCTFAADPCAGGDLSDYTGELALVMPLTVTDAYARGLPATSAGTFSAPIPCAATADASVGSTCSVITTADSLLPGSVREGSRALWELGGLEIWDGGADGFYFTSDDNTVFATQGLFVP